MASTLIDRLTRTSEEKKRLVEEEAILEVSELLCAALREENVSRSQLAERLGTSKANVTQILAGRRNMTVRVIADVLFALGKELRVRAAPLGAEEDVVSGRFTYWRACPPQEGSFRAEWQLPSQERAVAQKPQDDTVAAA
jgi:transcriptional regulator with XRE-family HTH domain